MKRGLTLIELIFVIIIIGILSAVLVPSFTRPTLTEAAHQVVSHIRYTQHLAMMENKFDPNNQFWYRQRWQIQFRATAGDQFYTIYSNRDGAGANAVQGDIARNPSNPEQFLTGRESISTNTGRFNKKMNLTQSYNINNVLFSASCSFSGSRRISFDYLGRPLFGNPIALDAMYNDNFGVNGGRLITNQCTITLTNNDSESIQIIIEPETGYSYIMPD